MNIVERYYLEKARRRFAGATDWYGKDVGMPLEDFMEMVASEWFYDWKIYWQAVRQLLRFDLQENGWLGWRPLPYHILCLVALLLGRSIRNHENDYQYETIDSWGYSKLYAGWEAHFIAFHPREFRYHIYKDGDWNM